MMTLGSRSYDMANNAKNTSTTLGESADKFILFLILAQVFILGFLGYNRYMNWLVTAIILVRLILSGWRLFDSPTLPLCISCIVILLIGTVLGGQIDTVLSNALMIGYPVVYSLYLYLLD